MLFLTLFESMRITFSRLIAIDVTRPSIRSQFNQIRSEWRTNGRFAIATKHFRFSKPSQASGSSSGVEIYVKVIAHIARAMLSPS